MDAGSGVRPAITLTVAAAATTTSASTQYAINSSLMTHLLRPRLPPPGRWPLLAVSAECGVP